MVSLVEVSHLAIRTGEEAPKEGVPHRPRRQHERLGVSESLQLTL